jgi:histone acetyltransferase (RNA polymerase elongator complex component)
MRAGTRLIERAEAIARQHGFKRLAVIATVAPYCLEAGIRGAVPG